MTSTRTPTSTRATTPTRRRRRWRWWHLVLVAVLVPVLGFAAWLVLIIVSFAGGLDDLFAGDPPRPDDPEVVAARTAAETDLAADSDLLTAAALLPALGPDARPVGRGEITPPCQEGQHNWKIDDDFDLRCNLDRVEVVAVPDTHGFEADMRALDAALTADGWAPAGDFGISSILDGYWDKRAELWAGYDVGDLPSARYYRSGDGAGSRDLVIEWAQPGSEPSGLTYYDEYADFHDVSGSEVSDFELLRAIPVGGYAVIATESVAYFSG